MYHSLSPYSPFQLVAARQTIWAGVAPSAFPMVIIAATRLTRIVESASRFAHWWFLNFATVAVMAGEGEALKHS